jgi:excisionase family DNA binding protein
MMSDLERTLLDWQDLPAVLNLQQAAAFMQIGYRRTLELCHSRGFPCLRLGRAFRISRDGLRKWLEQKTSSGGGEGGSGA